MRKGIIVMSLCLVLLLSLSSFALAASLGQSTSKSNSNAAKGTNAISKNHPTRASPAEDRIASRMSLDVSGETLRLGDINRDGRINTLDLQLLLSVYGQTRDQTSWWIAGYADLNGDGVVDISDLAALLPLIH